MYVYLVAFACITTGSELTGVGSGGIPLWADG